MRDAGDGETGNVALVLLVAAEAPNVRLVMPDIEADVIATWAGHHDGVALNGAIEALYSGSPLGP